MATCNLDIDHPNFRHPQTPSLLEGLKTLRNLLAQDYKLSGWVNHPMPRFPEFQNKVWKWDFRPIGERASTRKGWRLYAWVPEPKAPEPILAIAFLCYDKDETPTGDHPSYLAAELKRILGGMRGPEAEEPLFREHINEVGQTVCVCNQCYALVIISDDTEGIEKAKTAHPCRGGQLPFPD